MSPALTAATDGKATGGCAAALGDTPCSDMCPFLGSTEASLVACSPGSAGVMVAHGSVSHSCGCGACCLNGCWCWFCGLGMLWKQFACTPLRASCLTIGVAALALLCPCLGFLALALSQPCFWLAFLWWLEALHAVQMGCMHACLLWQKILQHTVFAGEFLIHI